jgi:uncharacterized protein
MMAHFRHLALLITVSISISACGSGASYDDEHADWKDRRVQSLRTNWVSLAGLYWLESDVNQIGSDALADVVFPTDAPALIGTLYRGNDGFEFQPSAYADVSADGRPFTGGELQTDADGAPTVLQTGPWRFSVIERYGRHAVRLYDDRRQDLLNGDDLPFYPLSSDWRIVSRFEAHPEPVVVLTPTFTGDIQDLISPGTVHFEIDGETYSLDVLEGSETRYFVMFNDHTNASETYEAGRYMYVDHEDRNGQVLLDFNQAYNPPCAFTPHATCPYPPPQNRLDVAVLAGEMRVREGW